MKDFFNIVSKSNKIFAAEDIGQMSSDEYQQNEKAIFYQMQKIGIPRRNQLNRNSDVIYVNSYIKDNGTQVKAHYRSKNGTLTKIDKEFDRPLNIQIKDFDTRVPNLSNYLYYNNLNLKLEQEVGNFLKSNTYSPQLYSNDIRHQYVSALYARNFGQEQAKWLGDLNEKLHFGNTGSGAYDTALDQLNNEIGRQYAKKYPSVTREQLLQILLNDWEKNSNYTKNILRKK